MTVEHQGRPHIGGDQVRQLIDLVMYTTCDGKRPALDVVRAHINELAGYLDTLAEAARSSCGTSTQLHQDAGMLLSHRPDPAASRIEQIAHLRALARVALRFLQLAERRDTP
ncbi:hypothetical protein U9R90_28900 [Streptomyces sp. E11-3]|uniref:hypothetical protein n=1 Tax=Streptomyces sp. E11-3 TaxID=3110112 RepID=UPI00397EAC6F